MSKIKNLNDAFEYALKNGGVSYNLNNGQPPKTGFMVGGYGTAKTIPFFNKLEFRQYIFENAGKLLEDEFYAGVWRDPKTGLWHLDVSLYVEDEQDARHKCITRDQLAYFDLEKKIEIYI